MTGQTISHFEILDPIGKGGMGVVYRARDMELDRLVAIKFLAQDIVGDAESTERFVREAKAASALDHPNICTIHEIGRTDDGRFFIVMGLYDGGTLKNRIDAGVTLDEAISFAVQIGRGLAAAHERGVVHRDIKPGNIVLTHDDRPVIVDFGLATLPGAIALTKTGSTIGTAAYMAPEQLTGAAVDGRTDVWALGVILYEMVNGRRPFAGAYEQAVSYAIMNMDPQPIGTEGDPRLPELQRIISQCLAKDPSERYPDARGLLADLEALSNPSGAREAAAASPPASQPKGFSSKAVVGAVSALAIVLVVSLAVFLSRTDSEETGGQEAATTPALLVLPFENLGPAEDAFFAMGVSDEITGRLSTLGSISVISRRSASRYAETELGTGEIGDELGVDYILEGQVRWARQSDGESRVRITPALIRVSDDTQLWAESYDRGIDDIFEIQAEVATRVAAELDARLSQSDKDRLAESPTENVAAYESFLRGSALFWDQEFAPAADAFRSALSLDPDFLQAAYLLARTYSFWYRTTRDAGADSLAKFAAETSSAVESLAPGSAEAHLAAGYYHYYVETDYARALAKFDVAVRLRPGDADAHASRAFVLRRYGRLQESASELLRASRLDPTHVTFLREAARMQTILRQYRRADSLYSRILRLDPLNANLACAKTINLLGWKGLTQEVITGWESMTPGREMLLSCGVLSVDMARRDYDKVLADIEAYDDTNSDLERLFLIGLRALANRYAGRHEAELSAWRELAEEGKGHEDSRQPLMILLTGFSQAGLGDQVGVNKSLARLDKVIADDGLIRSTTTGSRAHILTVAGRKKEAIDVLRADLESDVGVMTTHFLDMPIWDPLREEPAFQEMIAKARALGR